MATSERRKVARVTFEGGIAAYIMGIDGTWQRDCCLVDISDLGVTLAVLGTIEGLNLKEFFLLLSYGDKIGAKFAERSFGKSGNRRPQEVAKG
jgi:hypothetical protein